MPTNADLKKLDDDQIRNGTGTNKGRSIVPDGLARTRDYVDQEVQTLKTDVPNLVPVTDLVEFDSSVVAGKPTYTLNGTKLKAKLTSLGYVTGTPGTGGAGAAARSRKFLCLGQSLMDGVSVVNNPVPVELADTNYGATIFKRLSTQWEPLKAAYNTGCYDQNNWGPEVEMARLFVGRFGPNVRLIKFAKGATQLAFSNNADEDWSITSPGELLDQAKATITAALAAIPEDTDPIDAVVWKQGEADAFGANADAYLANLTSFFNNLWAWLGYQPFLILPQLSTNQTGLDATGRAKVIAAQASYCAVAANKATLVPTSTVTIGPDKLHPTSAGFKELGRLCAVAAIDVLTRPVVALPTPLAPTAPVINDTADTLDWTNTPNYAALTAYEYTLDGGSTSQPVTVKPLVVGNVAKAINVVGVRVKATANNTASPWLFNNATFNVAGGGSGTTQPLTGTNLLPSDDLADTTTYDYGDLVTPITSGQSDYAGGSTAYLLRPNTSSTDNHSYRNKVLSAQLTDGKSYVACVLLKPATGIKFFSDIVLNINYNPISRANFNLDTLQPEGAAIGNAATATLVAVGGGWYEARLYWTQQGTTPVYVFGKMWGTPGIDVAFAGNNTNAMYAHKQRIYEL